MYVGISSYFHESSVALINDEGKLLDFQKEEWHSRVKGDRAFPRLALKKIIEFHDINIREIKFIFYEKPLKSWLTIVKHTINTRGLLSPLSVNHFKNFWKSSISFYFDLLNNLETRSPSIYYCDHHLSHAMTANYYFDQFPCIAVVLDGFGDNKCSTIYHFTSSNKFKIIWTSNYPNSVGLFYSTITDFLGFSINSGEFKLMGLASFGSPRYVNQIRKMIYFENQKLELDMNFFGFDSNLYNSYSDKLELLFDVKANNSPLTIEKNKNFQKYADIATSAQVVLHEIVLKIFTIAHNLTGINNFTFTGGVALNCKLVSDLSKQSFINKLFIPPSPGDSGAAIGAAHFGFIYDKNKKRNLNGHSYNHMYPGNFKQSTSFLDDLFEKICEKNKIIDKSSELLLNGNILATCIDNIETGPRSLGNRSLLCNAENKDNVKKLSEKIKGRESFIPVAPSMLRETAEKYYQLNENINPCYFIMGATATLNTNLKDFRYKSIVHQDLTSRIHICDESTYIGKLLKNINSKTEILANTSFNFSNDPVSYSYEDSIMAIKKMDLEYLVTDTGIYKI